MLQINELSEKKNMRENATNGKVELPYQYQRSRKCGASHEVLLLFWIQ